MLCIFLLEISAFVFCSHRLSFDMIVVIKRTHLDFESLSLSLCVRVCVCGFFFLVIELRCIVEDLENGILSLFFICMIKPCLYPRVYFLDFLWECK